MNLAHLDTDHATGTQPIRHALQWFSTCIDANRVPWRPDQLEAAGEALAAARRHLDRDVLDIAGLSTVGYRGPAAVLNEIAPRAPELVAPGNAVAPVPAASVKLATYLDHLVKVIQPADAGFAQAVREWKEAGMPAADTVMPGNVTPTLTPSECKAVLADPRGLVVLMDYHEMCQLESDSVGAGTTGDNARIVELKAMGRVIIEADREQHDREVLKAFGYTVTPVPVGTYARLSLREVMDLTAMVWGAPVDDVEAGAVYLPLLQMYEQIRRAGKRPQDPATMTKAEAAAHWRQFNKDGTLPASPAPTKKRDGNAWLAKAKQLATEYAHCYAFVGDDTMPRKQKELWDHLAEPADLMQGSWIAAEDVLRNVMALDVAFNGEGGARAPRLIDVLSQVQAVRDQYREPLLQVLAHSIHLTEAEVQSGLDRVRNAAGLIKQLPDTHDGRNTWLMNYGPKVDAS